MLGLGEGEQQGAAVKIEVERDEAARVFQRLALEPPVRHPLAGQQAADHRMVAERLFQHVDAAGLGGVEAEVLVDHVPLAAHHLVVLEEHDPVEVQQRVLECDLPAQRGQPGKVLALLRHPFACRRPQRGQRRGFGGKIRRARL